MGDTREEGTDTLVSQRKNRREDAGDEELLGGEKTKRDDVGVTDGQRETVTKEEVN